MCPWEGQADIQQPWDGLGRCRWQGGMCWELESGVALAAVCFCLSRSCIIRNTSAPHPSEALPLAEHPSKPSRPQRWISPIGKCTLYQFLYHHPECCPFTIILSLFKEITKSRIQVLGGSHNACSCVPSVKEHWDRIAAIPRIGLSWRSFQRGKRLGTQAPAIKPSLGLAVPHSLQCVHNTCVFLHLECIYWELLSAWHYEEIGIPFKC